MERRKFLRLSTAAIAALSLPTSLKAYDHLKELTFNEVYPKPLWKKSYFSWILMGVTVVIAGVVSYFTAGAGAPEAAAGVSTVASWVGGGGAGSYMAGLSAIGSAVGGNAMVGAAILNGISLGTIGYSSSKITLTLASKIAMFTDITLSGVVFIKNRDTASGIYVFDIKIPKDLGSGVVRRLVNKIYTLNDEKNDALKDENFKKASEIDKEIDFYYNRGVELLKKEILKVQPSLENLFVLGIIAYKKGKIDLYHKALSNIDFLYKDKLEKDSFLKYLWGIYSLSTPNQEEVAFKYFQNSYFEENYVVEPVLAIISILGANYYKNKILIENWVKNCEEHYDSDKYDGKGLLSLYYKAGTQAFINEDWQASLMYFKKAYDELGLIGKVLWTTKPIKKVLKLYIAICYKKLGDMEKSKEYLNDALSYCETEEEKNQYLRMYNE